ncbi:MAG: hypothetical protein ACHQXA_07615 [Gemmatimonadales bacterium]
MPGPELTFGAAPRRRWLALAASLAAHALLIVAWGIAASQKGTFPISRVQLLTLYPPPAAGSRRAMPAYRGFRPMRLPGPRRGPGVSAAAPVTVPLALPEIRPLTPPNTALHPSAPTAAGGEARGTFGIVNPGLAAAKLWVEPLPLPPKELALALGSGNARLVDSAITVIVQHYLDSIATAPDRDRGPPDWTTTVAGTKFGLDAKNIYVAGLKIPTAILALLKLPGANESKMFERGVASAQEDLHRAATRAVTLEEFRQSVRELRAERQRQHDLGENAKLSPTDTAALRPAPNP